MTAISVDVEREYVVTRLARLFYLAQCRHKGWKPKVRTDSWAYEYASIAVDILGFDDTSITSLSDPTFGGAE